MGVGRAANEEEKDEEEEDEDEDEVGAACGAQNASSAGSMRSRRRASDRVSERTGENAWVDPDEKRGEEDDAGEDAKFEDGEEAAALNMVDQSTGGTGERAAAARMRVQFNERVA